MKSEMVVRIACEGIKDRLSVDKLVIIQGGLKTLSKDSAAKLKSSILTYGFVAPIFIWVSGKSKKTFYILDGTQRITVLKEMQEEGYAVPDLPVVYIQAKNKKQAKEILLHVTSNYGKLNKAGFIEFTADLNLNDLPDITFDAFDVNVFFNQEEKKAKLSDRFIVPPFSVLNVLHNGWKDRKNLWKHTICDFGNRREDAGGIEMKGFDSAVSVLDPVLSEIICHWFAPEQARILDPFAGDTVFGFVSSFYGHNFTGIEIRKEQAEFNNQIMVKNKLPGKYINGRAQDLSQLVEGEYDLIFSCPPYYDLEKYSSLPDDASNQATYKDYYDLMNTVVQQACAALKEDRFACIVIGDVRDKKGLYYDIPGDIKKMFAECGVRLYNEIIFINFIGSAQRRAGKYMKSRKVAKIHEYLLVFYKGNPDNIKNNFKELEAVNEIEDMGSEFLD